MVGQVELAARVVDLVAIFRSVFELFKFGTRIAPQAVRCQLACDHFAAARLFSKKHACLGSRVLVVALCACLSEAALCLLSS